MQAGKWYQVGTPFVPLTDGAEQTINNTFTTGFSTGDQLYVYDSKTGNYKSPYMWGTIEGQTGWWDLSTGLLASETLSLGQAVFISKSAMSVPGELILPGRVSTTTATRFGNASTASWEQVICVYPGEQELNDLKWEGLQEGDEAYLYDSTTGNYKSPYMWGTIEDQTGWWDLSTGLLASETLSPGQAVFINKKSAGEATVLPNVDATAE